MWLRQELLSLSLAHELVRDYRVTNYGNLLHRQIIYHVQLIALLHASMSTYDEERALYLHRNGRPRPRPVAPFAFVCVMRRLDISRWSLPLVWLNFCLFVKEGPSLLLLPPSAEMSPVLI